MGHEWEEKLFGCCGNIPVCLVTGLLPGGICAVQAITVDKATGHGAFIPCLIICCLGTLGGAINRETIRKHYEIEGGLLGSLCVWCFCSACAACQEYREVAGRTKA